MNLEFRNKIINLKSVNSTNEFAKKLIDKYNESDSFVITSDFQSRGKGQFNNSWESFSGKNLLMSVVISLKKNIKKKFDLNIISSLAVIDVLNEIGFKNISIKWPNDILVGSKKIAGILIETKSKGNEIYKSIIGLGFNVNQEQFKIYDREATSIKLEKNKFFDIIVIRNNFLEKLHNRFLIDITTNYNDYNYYLYLKGKKSTFIIGNKQIRGSIIEVDKSGEIKLRLKNDIKSFQMKEISYTI